MSTERSRIFPDDFDDVFAVGDKPGNEAFFGREVLSGLVSGIDAFIEQREERWRRYRSLGHALLACAPWIDDEPLLGKLDAFAAACVVMTKQVRSKGQLAKLERLRLVNERAPGLPLRPFPDLHWFAPKVDGKPLIVGPSGPDPATTVLPTIRTVGYRKHGHRDSPPLIHAKLALLGHLWWHDEGEFGVEDIEGFAPARLWVSSANFTGSSRRSLEFGYWTEDPALLAGAERFLLKLVRASEDLDPDSDLIEPELVEVDFDDEAMIEAMRDYQSDDDEVED
jgi:hypothetical protein